MAENKATLYRVADFQLCAECMAPLLDTSGCDALIGRTTGDTPVFYHAECAPRPVDVSLVAMDAVVPYQCGTCFTLLSMSFAPVLLKNGRFHHEHCLHAAPELKVFATGAMAKAVRAELRMASESFTRALATKSKPTDSPVTVDVYRPGCFVVTATDRLGVIRALLRGAGSGTRLFRVSEWYAHAYLAVFEWTGSRPPSLDELPRKCHFARLGRRYLAWTLQVVAENLIENSSPVRRNSLVASHACSRDWETLHCSCPLRITSEASEILYGLVDAKNDWFAVSPDGTTLCCRAKIASPDLRWTPLVWLASSELDEGWVRTEELMTCTRGAPLCPDTVSDWLPYERV